MNGMTIIGGTYQGKEYGAMVSPFDPLDAIRSDENGFETAIGGTTTDASGHDVDALLVYRIPYIIVDGTRYVNDDDDTWELIYATEITDSFEAAVERYRSITPHPGIK